MPVDESVAEEINKIFFEVIIAPDYSPEALETLGQKKNRIILVTRGTVPSAVKFRSMLGGALVQESRVTVNGSEGTLSVFAFDTTADALVAAEREGR